MRWGSNRCRSVTGNPSHQTCVAVLCGWNKRGVHVIGGDRELCVWPGQVTGRVDLGPTSVRDRAGFGRDVLSLATRSRANRSLNNQQRHEKQRTTRRPVAPDTCPAVAFAFAYYGAALKPHCVQSFLASQPVYSPTVAASNLVLVVGKQVCPNTILPQIRPNSCSSKLLATPTTPRHLTTTSNVSNLLKYCPIPLGLLL
jgi:hypothetical protein